MIPLPPTYLPTYLPTVLEELHCESISLGDQGMTQFTQAMNRGARCGFSLKRLHFSNSFLTYKSGLALASLISSCKLPKLQVWMVDVGMYVWRYVGMYVCICV